MFAPYLSSLETVYNGIAQLSVNIGTSVVPGASNAEGAWTQIASSANIAADVLAFKLLVLSGTTTAQAKNHLLDIGVDPAGGTSYTEVISNLACGASLSFPGRTYLFPLFIKAGSSVAVRVRGSNATAGTVRVGAKFLGEASRPELVRSGTFSETIGAITGSRGVSFTPGNSAKGAWASLGTTARAMWWWNLGVQIDNAVITAVVYQLDLAFGDATNKVMIIDDHTIFGGTSETIVSGDEPWAYRHVPEGAELWVRGAAGGTAVTGFNAVAVGIGG